MDAVSESAPESIGDIQRKHIGTYQSNVDRVKSDSGTERQDKAGYEGRFVFELLQNAVDEMDKTETPRVAIELTEDALIVANNGAEFTIEDLYALTLTTRTTKAGKRTIGHKGRGFTSVLNITNQPRVFSDAVQAKFDRQDTCQRLNADKEIQAELESPLETSDVPMLQLPFSADPSSRVREYLAGGFTTVFEFPLKNPDEQRDAILRKLQQLGANTVALLPALEEISIEAQEWSRTWTIERQTVAAAGEPTLVELTSETRSDQDSTSDSGAYLLFERTEINRDRVIEQAALDDSEIESMGKLSVGIAFEAERQTDLTNNVSTEWRLSPVPGTRSDQPPHVHVFLPTQEHSPIPALVTGTFQSDTSRRNLPLDYDTETAYEGDFNALLFAEVGKLLEEAVVPFAKDSATTPADLLAVLDPTMGGEREYSFAEGTVDHCLFESLREGLQTAQFLPANQASKLLSVSEIVVPYTSSDTDHLGHNFADIIGTSDLPLGESEAALPDRELLGHRATMTLRALGAKAIDVNSIPELIGNVPTAEISLDSIHSEQPTNESSDASSEPSVLYVDPVLVLLVEIRKTLDSDDAREAFDQACRAAPVFPTGTGTVNGQLIATNRSTDGDQPFFIPPETPVDDDALPGLSFLPRKLYHGSDPDAAVSLRASALPAEFKSALEATWTVADFGFERVFDAAIRPRIPGPNSQGADPTQLESQSTLTTIKTMADVNSPENDRTPEEPLLYKSSRRPFFDLCRLPVPAVPLAGDTEISWQPAHRVYFGADWQQALGRETPQHVEPLLSDVATHTTSQGFDPWILAPPEWFNLTPDTDEEELRDWAAFFSWLGVAEHIRPLPLFAPDPGTSHRYRKTKGFSRPPRSAISSTESLSETRDSNAPVDHRYTGLSDADWDDYRAHLLEHAAPLIEDPDQRYLFQLNPLEYAGEILGAAKVDSDFGARLFRHIAAWWDNGLSQHRHAVVAEFTNQRWRSSSLSYVFTSGERKRLGTNLWLWQLRKHAWIPTTLDSSEAVRPDESWALPTADRDRFSLHLESSWPLLPFLNLGDGAATPEAVANAHSLYEGLDIGTSLTQDSFTPTDAQRALTRISTLLETAREVENADMSTYAGEVELVYSRLADLFPPLEGDNVVDEDWQEAQASLSTVSVLCTVGDSYTLRAAEDAYFVRSESARDRYRDLGLPLLVLTKPETPGFGRHLGSTDIQDAVTTEPARGDFVEFPLDIDGFGIDDQWLETVLAALLVRIRVDRSVDADTRNTVQFRNHLYPVDGLELTVQSDADEALLESDSRPRPYYIGTGDEGGQKIDLDATLPRAEFVDALAQAYTEYVGIPQYYEAAYNLVNQAFGNTDPTAALAKRLNVVSSGQNEQRITRTRDRIFGHDDEHGSVITDALPDNSTGSKTDTQSSPQVTEPTGNGQSQQRTSGPRSNRVPPTDALQRIGDREVLTPERMPSTKNQATNGGAGSGKVGGGGGSGVEAPSQEYRKQIDEFGMVVTMEAERNRLRERGESRVAEKVWDVSTPERFEAARDNDDVEAAIQNSPDPTAFDTDWPGFDVLTIRVDDSGAPQIDRCIELKSSGRKTRKPSLSWNEWKAASTTLAEHYYLYVARNIQTGNSGDATLLEIPRPFQTLNKHRRERREREIQLDLRSFDFDDETLIERTIEWGE